MGRMRVWGGVATTWSGLTELLFAKKLNVLCLDSAKATQSKWKYSRVAPEMFFSRVAEFGGAISSGNSEPSWAALA